MFVLELRLPQAVAVRALELVLGTVRRLTPVVKKSFITTNSGRQTGGMYHSSFAHDRYLFLVLTIPSE